jgi:hypothetical protein
MIAGSSEYTPPIKIVFINNYVYVWHNHINKYIEQQVNKALNIDQSTISTTIFPNNIDNIMEDAIPIWNVLGLTEQERNI